jgi:peptide/nickel transport system ATP-binding protein
MTPLLELSHVSKAFGLGGLLSRRRIPAVDDVGFALEADAPEIFTIVGQSGSGKTTLARMILGMNAPTSGMIRFLGQDLAHIRGTRSRKQFMGAVQPIFQNPFEAFNPQRQPDRYLFLTARRFVQRSGARTDQRGYGPAPGRPLLPGRRALSPRAVRRAAAASSDRAGTGEAKPIVADEPVSMVDASLHVDRQSVQDPARRPHLHHLHHTIWRPPTKATASSS